MSEATDLLRSLEPTVRPTNTPAITRVPIAPFEYQSFDSLLEEAQRKPAESAIRTEHRAPAEQQQGRQEAVAEPRKATLLSPLLATQAVGNASVMRMLANRTM